MSQRRVWREDVIGVGGITTEQWFVLFYDNNLSLSLPETDHGSFLEGDRGIEI